MVVKARFIIESLFPLSGFIIVFYLLFRIRLYSFIIIFKGFVFFLCVVSGFYIGLCALKSPRRIALPRSNGCHYISSMAR